MGKGSKKEEEKRESKGSKKAQRSGSNVFAMFSPRQLAEFKEAFGMMDVDKDGIIGKSDLKATYDNLGASGNDREMDEMIAEATGPLNFTMLLTIFGNRMSGGGSADDDESIAAAFRSFDNGGKIDAAALKTALMTFGEKFTSTEADDIFGQLGVEGGKIDTGKLIGMLTASAEQEEA